MGMAYGYNIRRTATDEGLGVEKQDPTAMLLSAKSVRKSFLILGIEVDPGTGALSV